MNLSTAVSYWLQREGIYNKNVLIIDLIRFTWSSHTPHILCSQLYLGASDLPPIYLSHSMPVEDFQYEQMCIWLLHPVRSDLFMNCKFCQFMMR